MAVSKLLWVAWPLLLAGAWLGVQALRGRAPSRSTVHLTVSLLLLAYVATTAGLGIFWVANQQLPVFDWHYLFGYGTALLVALHLVFTGPVVWRLLTHRRTAAGGAGPATRAPQGVRRGLLTVLGIGGLGTVAFLLGVRQGRGERAPDGPAGPETAPGAATGAAATETFAAALTRVERFHAVSSHGRADVLTRAPSADWGGAPAPFKTGRGSLRRALPPPGGPPAGGLTLGALGDSLWHTVGITARQGGLALRASPSSGALFATELYVVARGLDGLPGGVWHYDPVSHALVSTGPAAAGPPAAQAQAVVEALAAEVLPSSGSRARGQRPGAAGSPPVPAESATPSWRDAPVLVVATAVWRRTTRKYGDRSYRYILADLGHALENLRAAAAAHGLVTGFARAFDESQVARALQVDETEEGVLAVLAFDTLGPGRNVPQALPEAARPPLPDLPRAWTPAAAASGTRAGHTALMHGLSSLRAADTRAARPPGQGIAAPAHGATAPWRALPAAAAVPVDERGWIARRRSVRRFRDGPLGLQALSDVLGQLEAHEGPWLSAAVRVNLVVHAVQGLAPGVYRHDPAAHALQPRRVPAELRSATRAAALDQEVMYGAAVVLVLSIDRAVLAADPWGPARGYRHAFLEAGRMGERVYLAAGAQGLGACSVGAFYDDEAAALVGVDPAREWVVHFSALGRPA